MGAVLGKMTIVKRVDGVPVIRETITARELGKLLNDAPAVDAVPVVRCRDCQWGDQNTCGDGYWCWKYGIGVSEDHFCAKGVKAKEESDESE